MLKSMYTLFFESINDKYFQNSLNPSIILEGPYSLVPCMRGKGETTISGWSPLIGRIHNFNLDEMGFYTEISKEKFNELKNAYTKGLEKKVEFNIDKKEITSFNKPNQSERISLNENPPDYSDRQFLNDDSVLGDD